MQRIIVLRDCYALLLKAARALLQKAAGLELLKAAQERRAPPLFHAPQERWLNLFKCACLCG